MRVCNEKLELERLVLDLSLPLLRKMYGEITVDSLQIDRPDAAIEVVKPRKQADRNRQPFSVGIEITTIDTAKSLAYFNDEKHGKHIQARQVNDILENGSHDVRPFKSMDVDISKSCIYDAAIKKKDKYQEYIEAKRFREVILICFSDILGVSDGFFKNSVLGWTEYYLKKANCPFDKVLFVGLKSRGGVQKVYDRYGPVKRPILGETERVSVRRVRTSTLPVGKAVNILSQFNDDPLVKPKGRK